MESNEFPQFFRVRQTPPRPKLKDVAGTVHSELSRICGQDLSGRTVAITVGSRGIHNLSTIVQSCVAFFQHRRASPFLVPSMGSHGGGTAEGQKALLAGFGITENSMGCEIRSSMETVEVCTAKEGFPVHFDRQAWDADHVFVVNRIKPHTRFNGQIESGLMKMMLIGLGKQRGAEVYHRAIVNYSFDQIVRSVAQEVIQRCRILGGLAILENAYEETADVVGVAPESIETTEPELLSRVKQWMSKLPFDHADFLIVDQIGKNISGTGMDTNVIGRKFNDHAAILGDSPDIHTIYVRSLTEATHGNASGIGLAEMCHKRVVRDMDPVVTRNNCITACHPTGAMIPIDFDNDRSAIQVACQISGFKQPRHLAAMWIRDTLSLTEVECSQHFYEDAVRRPELEVVRPPTPLQFDLQGDLQPRF